MGKENPVAAGVVPGAKSRESIGRLAHVEGSVPDGLFPINKSFCVRLTGLGPDAVAFPSAGPASARVTTAWTPKISASWTPKSPRLSRWPLRIAATRAWGQASILPSSANAKGLRKRQSGRWLTPTAGLLAEMVVLADDVSSPLMS